MSREFGEHAGGFFHQKIQGASEDAKGGRDILTQLWGQFLIEFSPIAYQIGNSEACDSGPDAPISETIFRIDALQRHLDAIKNYVNPYKKCMEAALRKKVASKKDDEDAD